MNGKNNNAPVPSLPKGTVKTVTTGNKLAHGSMQPGYGSSKK